MSRPSQPKLNTADHNGVSVIQSQAHASSLQQVPQLVPANPSTPGGKALAPRKMKKPSADKDSDEYRQRRERNNLAVKKSRMRSKQKAMDTQQRVNELKEENERLEAKIKLLSKELSVLKDLFLEHAHNLADNVQAPTADGSSPAPNASNGQWGTSRVTAASQKLHFETRLTLASPLLIWFSLNLTIYILSLRSWVFNGHSAAATGQTIVD